MILGVVEPWRYLLSIFRIQLFHDPVDHNRKQAAGRAEQ
jgi:hypothetical protein